MESIRAEDVWRQEVDQSGDVTGSKCNVSSPAHGL